MPIEINPNRINRPVGGASKADRRKRETTDSGNVYTIPTRSELNYIPSAESLFTLISSAVEALRQGIYWDRGTIINLVV